MAMPKSAKPPQDKADKLKQTLHLERDVLADWKQLEADALRTGEDFPSLSGAVNDLLRQEIARRRKAAKPTM